MAGNAANDIDALTVRTLLRIAAIGIGRTAVGFRDTGVGAVIPRRTGGTLRRNAFAVYGLVSRLARRASVRRTSRAVGIQFGTRGTAVSVLVISALASGASIAPVAVLGASRTVVCAALARRFAVISAGDLASALACGDLSRRTGGASRAFVARHAGRIQSTAVFTFVTRAAIRIGRTFGFNAVAFPVGQIARGTVSLFARIDRHASRVGQSRVLTFVTRGTFLGRRTCGRRASAFAVGQLTFGTSARSVFLASYTFGRRSRGIFALLTRAAIRIRRARENRTLTLSVGQSPRRARIFATAVVAGLTAFTLAKRGVPVLSRGTAFRSPAHAAARAVRHRIAGAVAFLAFFIRHARTFRRAVLLTGRTLGRPCAVTSAVAVRNLRSGTSAFFAGFAFHTRAVRSAFITRGARCFRAFANGFVVFGRTFGRRPRTRGISANFHAPFLFAFLGFRTIRIGLTQRQIGGFFGNTAARSHIIRAVAQFDSLGDLERRSLVKKRCSRFGRGHIQQNCNRYY